MENLQSFGIEFIRILLGSGAGSGSDEHENQDLDPDPNKVG